MSYDSKEMLRETVIPILLGDNLSSHRFAARIYLRCGIVSYMCDERRRAVDLLDPFSKFFPLNSRRDPRVICDILGYLASGKDYLPILVPFDGYYKAFVDEYRDFLESRFIISDAESFFKEKPMSVF